MARVRIRSRWLAGGLLWTGSSLAFPGCANTSAQRAEDILPVVRIVQLPSADGDGANATPHYGMIPVIPGKTDSASGAIAQASYQPPHPEKLPNLPAAEPAKPDQLPAPTHAAPAEKLVPINLDTVFRLAEQQNAQVALAREKLRESEAKQALASKAWLPKVYAGVGYYRHEGGIQNEDGTLTHSSFGALFYGLDLKTEIDLREATFTRVTAERESHQSRGELSKVTSETLLEAASTYMDLLTARRGEAVALELEKYLADLAERTDKMVTPADRSAQVLVEAARAELSGSKQAIAKLHQQGDAAAAKLAYLLGLDCARLVPMEETLAPIELVDPTPCAADLVERARETGPGVRELAAMLAAMQDGLDRVSGPIRYAPVVSLNMSEGGLYAGPGGELSPDNVWNTGLQLKWNLTEFITNRERRRVAESRVEQARISLDDLRGKLTAGVQEARDASLSGREQIAQAAEQVRHAAEGYRLSDQRLKVKAPNATAVEVLQAIRGLETAHFNYLTAINAHNKAQIRLLVLLGPAATQDQKPAKPPVSQPALVPEIQ